MEQDERRAMELERRLEALQLEILAGDCEGERKWLVKGRRFR